MPEKIIGLFFVVWLALGIPSFISQGSEKLINNMKGEWVDTAFSDILSQRYDCPVKVSHVTFRNWSEIHFASIVIQSKEGRDLIYGSKGSFKLIRMELKKLTLFETEIDLRDVFFTKEYYKNSPALRKWGHLAHKPIPVKELKLRVIQDPGFTKLSIIDCKSDILKLEGGLLIDKTGRVEDLVKISYNPWALLKLAF